MSWDDWSAVNQPPIVDDDKWHVALAPGEVKVVSLEQLDDLFRLSIVDAETKVWQSGMSEWQPLRVIADLDDAPAPAPRRTLPKPPSPRSAPPPRPQSVAPPPPSVRPAPPPPRPQSAAPPSPSVRPAPPPPRPQSVAPPSPSVRPAPPPPRPQSVAPPSPSVRPAPPPPRPQSAAPAPVQPRPQSVAPAPVYAEPLGLAATQPAFIAPRAVQPIASARPLVVTARPPVAQGGGGFGRFLIGLSLVAGVGISLYRNGVVRDAAQATHQGALFSKLENALGGPAFGTLRAVEQDSAARRDLNSDLNASLAADAPATANAAPTPAPEAAPTHAQPELTHGAGATPVVALESLAPEKPGAAKPKSEAATPTNQALAAPAPKLAAQPKFVATTQAKAAPAKPAAVEKPAAPSKPASEMTERERLNAAIGQSMLSTPPKAKSKASKASEYDPLNPKL